MAATLCRDIVRRALRKLSRFAAGAAPDGDSLTDGIETLQAIFLELAGAGMFGPLYDVIVTDATYDALPQQRVLCNRLLGVAVNLPATLTAAQLTQCVGYGQGCWDYEFRSGYFCGAGPWPPPDGSCIEINSLFDNQQTTHIYESSSARWIDLRSLSADSHVPLAKFSDGLAAMLAERMASEYGMQTPPEVSRASVQAKYSLTHRNDGVRGTQYAPERYY